jgi:predicted transposase YbfD/YdcC
LPGPGISNWMTRQRSPVTADVNHASLFSFEVPKDFPNRSLWEGLTTIGMVVYTFSRGGKVHTDIRYYLSRLPLDVALFAKCVRNHGGIENTGHWSLDVTYNADGLKSRNRRRTENIACLRRFTLSLLKQHPAG